MFVTSYNFKMTTRACVSEAHWHQWHVQNSNNKVNRFELMSYLKAIFGNIRTHVWRYNSKEVKYRRAASCVHLINVLKLEETRATVPKIFFFTNLDTMFVDISLRFIMRDFHVDFLKLAPLHDFKTSLYSVKTISRRLKRVFMSRGDWFRVNATAITVLREIERTGNERCKFAIHLS